MDSARRRPARVVPVIPLARDCANSRRLNTSHRAVRRGTRVNPYFEFANKGYNVDFASIQGDTPPFVGYDNTQILSKNFKEGNGFKRLNFSHKLR